jgi:hypothetical protein
MATKVEMASEIDRLRHDCAQAYQIIGVLAARAGLFEHHNVVRALDNFTAASGGCQRPYDDLLPFDLDETSEP